MPTNESKLLIRFEQLERETNRVESWQIESSYMTSTDAWEAVLYDTDRTKLFDLELQPVELLVNGASQLLGRVDRTEFGNNGSSVTITGRDYLADMVECNVDPSLKVTGGDELFAVITLACSPIGIDTVVSDDDIAMREIRSGIPIKRRGKGRGTTRKGKHLKDYKPHPGEGIYQYLNRIIARFGCTIQPGPDRQTLVICAPRYDQDPAYNIVRTDDPTRSARNNVISSHAVRDFSKFPTYTLVTGTQVQDTGAGVGAVQAFDMSVLAQEFNDELGRILLETVIPGRRKPGEGASRLGFDQVYRLLYYRDEACRDQSQLTQISRRIIAERLKDTLEYSVTLRGHTDPKTGAVWSVDTIAQVDDVICNVHEPLWIASRTLSFSQSEGATAQLKCLRPHAFEIGDDQ